MRAQIEASLRDAIRSGRLAPSTRLPSTRELCMQLGVSRGVVSEAYTQLAAEGYLRTRHGAGTTVAATTFKRPRDSRHEHAPRPPRYDLSPFRPALSAFPRSAWLAALTRASRSTPDERLGYPDPAGAIELRTALAGYLGRARGVQTVPDRVVVLSSLRQGLSLLWSVLAAGGAKRVAVEAPGWRGVPETAREAGLASVGVDVDEQGLLVEQLEAIAADAVAVAPAHQFPTGAVMSAPRRNALVRWCKANGAIAVEDDYDAEYRYDRRPVGALQGLAPDQVVYGGSASKSLAPSMRLGWLALPPSLVSPIARLQGLRGGMPSALPQIAFADLIERGELDRHLRRQRRCYQARRDTLLQELQAQLPDLRVQGAAAGLFIVLRLPSGANEQAVLSAANANGLQPLGLGARAPGMLIGYANLSEAAIPHAVRLLALSIEQSLSHQGKI